MFQALAGDNEIKGFGGERQRLGIAGFKLQVGQLRMASRSGNINGYLGKINSGNPGCGMLLSEADAEIAPATANFEHRLAVDGRKQPKYGLMPGE